MLLVSFHIQFQTQFRGNYGLDFYKPSLNQKIHPCTELVDLNFFRSFLAS